MPIPVRVVPTRPPVVYPVPPTPVLWDRTAVSITGASGAGEEIPLTGFTGRAWPSIVMQAGATGLDMPPYAIFSDDSPSLDGSIYRSSRTTSREIMIPLYLYGVDRQTLNALKRKLFQALNPKRGFCVLKFTEGSGQARRISVYYKDGLDGAEGVDVSGFTWCKYALLLTAMDPWFYPSASESTRWDFGTGLPFLSTSRKFFPMQISRGTMGGPGSEYLVSNPGDEDAWPVWELTGPIKSFSLTSPKGEVLKAAPPDNGIDLVPDGRVMEIDTRPGKKTVKDDQGMNYWAALDANPSFWPIEPGDSKCSISVVAGSGRASVRLAYTPRYASYI
ncbi:phage tail domain-containing protein [Streptomyces sp. NPDC051561]|uniref:phage tail domain-containing protein n=1 Tax=Streptomyces sp. NPDC051561 TaxID=3365658 RepID=UPI00378F0333